MALELGKREGISNGAIDRFSRNLREKPEHRTLTNAIKKNGINAVALNLEAAAAMPQTFSIEIETGPITHQRQSGRCWMFAGLNVLRVDIARRCNLKGFELSQAYQMFWDKLEKANYFLENILDTVEEPVDGRLVAWLLSAPLNDGGQWDMFVNLVEKYGVVPKYVMPESFHSSQSMMMNRLMTQKLREDAARLRAAHAEGMSLAELRQKKDSMVEDIYGMLSHFLGEPPRQFDFEYRDRDNGYHADRGLTPQAFLAKYVDRDLHDYVSVINAPTADKPYGRTYTVQFLGNVVGGRDVLYLNLESDALRQLAIAQLQDNEPVWFGCDVGKMLDRDQGIMDTALYDYETALGVKLDMTKAERLDFGESLMTHAMVFTGVNLVDGRPNRWKVENSWGTEPGKDGWFVMSDPWFDQYMYQVVVHRKYLSEAQQDALSAPPKQLHPWDPMGSLALMR